MGVFVYEKGLTVHFAVIESSNLALTLQQDRLFDLAVEIVPL
jgi:hypothetical protein